MAGKLDTQRWRGRLGDLSIVGFTLDGTMLQTDSHPVTAAPKRRNWRGYWVRTMVQWHWISSAVCLIGMVLFAITGITLNHAGQIEAQPAIRKVNCVLPTDLLDRLQAEAESELSISSNQKVSTSPVLPQEVAQWLQHELQIAVANVPGEWSSEEVYLSNAGPGQDAWLSIDLETGDVEGERTWRGWIAYLNDLHKGRHAGLAWKFFLDFFSVATLVFCFTGLMLLVAHAKRRQMTWPLVSLGLIVPALIAILLIH